MGQPTGAGSETKPAFALTESDVLAQLPGLHYVATEPVGQLSWRRTTLVAEAARR